MQRGVDMQPGEPASEALERLRAQGYDVLHQVRWPGRRRATIDHVAIGPAGIIVVDAKNWSGAVSVHHGRLRLKGQHRDKELAGVSKAAIDVAGLLAPALAADVIPVLCLVGDHDVHATRCAGVTVVDVCRLPDWARGLPGHLSPSQVHGIAAELRRTLPPASGPTPPPAEPRPAHQQHTRTATGRPSLAKLAVLLVLLLSLPAGVYWWSANGTDVRNALFPKPVPAAAAVPPTPVYASCRALRAAHPGGVASAGAHNTGRKLRRSPVVTTSQPLFAANSRLDRDGDQIACEVTRPRQHPR